MSALLRLRFVALASVVFLVVMGARRARPLDRRNWEHGAVVRELITHPLHPRHPLLFVNAPHAFANPYALIVAWLCRVAGVSSVFGRSAASLLNLLMLFVALRVFARRFAPCCERCQP